MLYELGYRSGVSLGEEVIGLEFKVTTQSLSSETMSVDLGGLSVNGSRKGPSAEVYAGDTVSVYVSASTTKGTPVFVNVLQDGILAGTFVVISEAVSGSIFDEEYLDLEPYEVLPDSNWTASPLRGISVYDKVDLTLKTTVPLSDSPILDLPEYRTHIHDYHRDMTYVLDSTAYFRDEPIFKGIIPTDLLGPVSDFTLFDTAGVRYGFAVAYRKSNKIVIFDESYNVKLEIESQDPLKVSGTDGTIFILEKGATSLRKIEFDDVFAYTETPLEYGIVIKDFVVNTETISAAIVSGTTVVDFDGTVYSGMSRNAFKVYYEPVSDVILVNHGLEGGQTYFRGETGLRTRTLKETNIKYHTYTEIRRDGGTEVIYVDDVGHNLYTQDIVDPPGLVKQAATTEGPSYGIAILGNLVFIPNLYADIDLKILDYDTEPDLYNLGESQLGYVGTVVDSIPVTLEGINVDTQVFLPEITTQETELLVNGVPSGKSATVVAGDTLAIRTTSIRETGQDDLIPVVIGQTIYSYTLLPNTPNILPRYTVFLPKVVAANTEICLDSNTVFGLGLGVTQTVTTDNGLLMVNGDADSKAASVDIEDGDSLSLCLTSGPDAYDVVSANITYADIFTSPVYITTVDTTVEPNPVVADLDFQDPDSLDIMNRVLNVKLGQSVISSPAIVELTDFDAEVDVKIPDIYDSFLVINGIQLPGHTAKVKHGDTISIGLTSTFNYLTDHSIPMVLGNSTFYFIAQTIPDYVPNGFYFGFKENLHIADRVLSDIVTVSGLMEGTYVPLVIPYGTVPIIDGVRLDIANHLLDYRGVLTDDFHHIISNGSTLQLEGFARPTYGDRNVLEVTIGYRTGLWELSTFEVEEYESNILPDVVSIDRPDYATTFMRKPVLVERTLNTSIVSVSTRPVLTPLRVASIPSKGATIKASKAISVVNPSVSTYADTSPISALVGSSSVLVDRQGSILGSLSSSKALSSIAYGKNKSTSLVSNNLRRETHGSNDVMSLFRGAHRELVNGYEAFKSEGSAPKIGTRHDGVTVFIHNPVSFSASDIRDLQAVIFPDSPAALMPAIPWAKDELRQPVLVSYNSDSTIYPRAETIKFERSFVVYQETPNNIKAYRPEAIAYDNSGYKRAARQDTIVNVHPEIKWATPYKFNAPVPPALAERIFKVIAPKKPVAGPRLFKVLKNSTVVVGARPSIQSYNVHPVVVTRSPIVVPIPVPVKWTRPDTIVPDYSRLTISRPDTVVITNPTVYMSSKSEVFFDKFTDSYLDGTFETAEIAEQAAEAKGLVDNDYSIVPYGGRFIWIRVLPCENMCYDCPPAGYIQGG